MATKLRVTYLDGKEVEVIATPKAQVMTERFLKGFSTSSMIEAGYRLAFESLTSRQLIDAGLGYEEWLDKIADVNELCKSCGGVLPEDGTDHECPEPGSGADESADPTPEAPSLTNLSD